MDYSNPFSANGVNTNFDGNSGGPGFVNQWTTMEQTEKNEQAKPFIDMARQAQELDLQKKKQETGEFMGQEQTQLRAKKIMKEGQQIDADIQRINPTLSRDLQKLQEEMQLSPFEMEAKKVQAMEIARNLKGKPAQEFISEAADYYNAFSKSKADPLTQAASYKEFIDGFKAKHPDTAIPPNMETWSDNLGKYLGLARMSSLMSIAHQQQLDIHEQDNDSKERVAEGNNRATVGAATATADAGERNNQRTVEGKATTNEQKYLDHVQTSVDKARANMWQVGLGLPPEEKKKAQEDYIRGVREDAMNNYKSIIDKQNGGASPPVNPGDGIALPASQEALKDGQVYSTARGKAKWNSKTKKFSPI